MKNVKTVKQGKTVRKTYSKINEVVEMPNLIEVQKDSYKWFLEEGLREAFKDVFPIKDYQGNLVLDFIDYELSEKTKYTIEECKERDATYAAPLHVIISLLTRETKENEKGEKEVIEHVQEQKVYMGDFPKMTDSGTFIINGAERVIVSQLVRSPGVYFASTRDKAGKELFSSVINPNRGAWLEYESDSNDIFYVRIDKNRKLPITTFIRALGISSNEEIISLIGDNELIRATLEKDSTQNTEEALIEVYRKLRPGEPPTIDSAQSHIDALFFDCKRYDLSRVGRYKYNKKLAISDRIDGRELAMPVADPRTGEIIADEGEVLTTEKAKEIEKLGVSIVYIKVDDDRIIKVMSNGMVNINDYVDFDCTEYGIKEKVRYSVLMDILDEAEDDEETLRELIRMRCDQLVPKNIITDDIFASINYMCGLVDGIGGIDDIDHLGNRRIRCVGELLQNQFRIGFSRMERVVKERMTTQSQNPETMSPQSLINIRPVVASIKEFFGSSPLSQFMDQTNPLSELTHKRRLSALGPGGLSRDRAGFEVRDVHYTHYGRMCPIETPEGPNIGLISYLASFAKINEYGFIEAPYRKVDKETGIVLNEYRYMTADVEDNYVVAQANEPLTEDGKFARNKVTVRYRDSIQEVVPEKVDYMDVSPKMVLSVATSMIPFLENDDANRALMGSNMQKQAVPLLTTEAPIVATGMEYKAAVDSGVVVLAKHDGVVERVSADEVVIRTDDNKLDTQRLIKFLRSNQGTCINQRPIVSVGERVKKGQVIADGPSTDQGEIALGKNMLIGFMTWEGYNYEDAVLINERLVKEDIYTSVHIAEYEIEARETKLGPEEITRDIPNVGEDMLKNLDSRGIIRVGAEVKAGDILVGKVTPKGETELNAEERLLRAIFGEKAREVRDNSLKVPHGEYGIVVDVKVFTRENSNELSPGVNSVVRCYIAQKRKLQVGDKMAGRHGNKGVVSRVLPQEDMPYLPDGTPLDICLNPLGVPSRMNIGQVLEVHLGMAAAAQGCKVMTPVFDGAHEEDIRLAFKEVGLREDGKIWLRDGRTGEQFDNPVTVGYMYYLKLHHLVDDKIHARSTGPYSLVTQQPLGGKAQFGGQRFGEMEVWALEAYGAAYTLQEILTVKSDDISGRLKTFEAIVKGKNVPKPGVPEGFKVLIKELQSLCLDVRIYDKDQNEIDLQQTYDDDDVGLRMADEDSGFVDEQVKNDNEFQAEGYGIEEEPSEWDDEDKEPSESDLESVDEFQDFELDSDDMLDEENY